MKDNIWVAGRRTTCASRILDGFRPPGDSTVAARLRQAGAVFIGRANMDEFAMGSSTENSSFHVTRNPWDTTRIPGGSSGGSAAAVAARFVPAGFGSDTGGSIRQPAACCGVVGFKPTYGRVSRYGLVAFASSLDQIGPLTRSVADAARLYGVVAGADPLDSTTADVPVGSPEAALGRGVEGLRVGFLEEAEDGGLDPEVAANLEEARRIFREAGAEVLPVSVPRAPAAIAIYYVIASAEASSNLARFDGVRYGPRRLRHRPAVGLRRRVARRASGPKSSAGSCSGPSRSPPATTRRTTGSRRGPASSSRTTSPAPSPPSTSSCAPRSRGRPSRSARRPTTR